MTQYRSDVDGLRALAVLPVVAYHLGVHGVPGGFIGVDVFFVISGFLIGSLVHGELRAGTFSLANFFARRIRRLFPALFAMMATTMVAAYFIYYPTSYAELAKSLIASALSTSNFYFWLTTDYFHAPGATRPLLHTWSLAVEEQFYLLFPPLLMLVLRRRPERATMVITALAAVSFILSSIEAERGDSAAFYLLHSRAWELLLGVLMALGVRPSLQSAASRNAVGMTGLVLVVILPFLISDELSFPGATALLPCLGAAMVISAGAAGDNLASRLLSWRPLVLIGLMSYSLYLWHWPMIVLAKYQMGVRFLPWQDKLALGGASLLVAYLSWRFIEIPGRRGWKTRSHLFVAAAASAGLLIAVSSLLLATGGLPARFPAEVVRIASYLDRPGGPEPENDACFFLGEEPMDRTQAEVCTRLVADRANILVIGDSHGEHLVYGLRRALPDVHVMQLNTSICRPLLKNLNGHRRRNCVDMVRFLFKDYFPRNKPDLVVIASRWDPTHYESLADTLDWFQQQRIQTLLVGRILEYSIALPALLAMSIRFDDSQLPERMISKEPEAVNRRLASIARARGVPLASTYRALCPGSECTEFTPDGIPVQWDYGHLTPEGSVLVARRLVESRVFCKPLGSRSRHACPR